MPCVYLKYLEPSFLVGNLDLYLSVKPSWPSQCWVYCIWPVSCSDNNNLTPSFKTIHKRQQLGDTSSLFGAMESISSMKIIVGDFSFASLNISLSLASDSP